ncbi:MAG: SH3 domain-containing protein, partial [Pseudomonadota bacterium]
MRAKHISLALAIAATAAAGAWTSPLQAQAPTAADDPALALPASRGGVRRWEVVDAAGVDLRATAAPDGRVVATLDPGTVLANLGCEPQGAVLWCKVRPFRGGARGFVPARSVTPATGPDGTVAMGRDDSDARAKKRRFDQR